MFMAETQRHDVPEKRAVRRKGWFVRQRAQSGKRDAEPVRAISVAHESARIGAPQMETTPSTQGPSLGPA
jgi:hypothetical protein